MRIPNIEKGTKVLYAILVPTLHFTILRVRLILTDNSRNKSRSFVNNVSVPKSVYYTGFRSLENCEKFLLLLVKQRSTLAREMRVSIVYGRVISHRNTQINRDACIVVACIIRYYIS